MKTGDVIYLKFDKGSFSWSNGLKVVINIDESDNSVHLCDIEEDGDLQKFDDGRYMCSVTSLHSKFIHPTKLSYQLEPGFKFL